MVHLPENHLSVVVMTNSMNHQCTEFILKNLVNLSLKELNAYSIIPSFDFFPFGFVIIAATTYWIVFVIMRMRRRMNERKKGENSTAP